MSLRVGYQDDGVPLTAEQLDALSANLVATDDSGNTEQIQSVRIGPSQWLTNVAGVLWITQNAWLHESAWYLANSLAPAYAQKFASGAIHFYWSPAVDGIITWYQTGTIDQNGYQLAGTTQRGVVAVDGTTIAIDGQGKISAAGAVPPMTVKGVWNATTNSPHLAAGIGTQGDLWLVGTAGTTSLDGGSEVSAVGDWWFFSGGTWHYLAMGTVASADFITYSPPWTGAIPRSVSYWLSQTVYLTQFGGAVGDDWTVPFQRAAAFMSTRHGTLMVPAGLGDIRITETITFTGANVWLKGEGGGINAGEGSRVIVDTVDQDGFIWEAGEQCGIRDIVISGPMGNARLTGGSLIKVLSSFNFGMDNIVLQLGYRAATFTGGLFVLGSNFRVRGMCGDYAIGCTQDDALGLRAAQNTHFTNYDISNGNPLMFWHGDGVTTTFHSAAFLTGVSKLDVYIKDGTTYHNTHLVNGTNVTLALSGTGVDITLPAPLALGTYLYASVPPGTGCIGYLYDGSGGSGKFVNFTGEWGDAAVVIRNTTGTGNVAAFTWTNGGFENCRGDGYRFETGGDYRLVNVGVAAYGHGVYVKYDPAATQNVTNVQQYGSTNLIQITTSPPHGFDGTLPVVVDRLPSVPQAMGHWDIQVLDASNFVLLATTANDRDPNAGLPSTWIPNPGDPAPTYVSGDGFATTRIAGTGDVKIVNSIFRGCHKAGLRVAMPRVQISNSSLTNCSVADRPAWAFELSAPPTNNGSGLLRCHTLEPHYLDDNSVVRILNLFLSGSRQLSYVYVPVTVIDANTVDLQGTTYAGPYDAINPALRTFLCVGGGQVQLDPTQQNFQSHGNILGDQNDHTEGTAYGVYANTANPYALLGDSIIGNVRGPIRKFLSAAKGQLFRPVFASAAGSLIVDLPSDVVVLDSGGCIDGVCTGSPNGAIVGTVGSTLRRRDGGANTSMYVKESGTGNTGWVAK
jgi:hypothetical protein